jgi:uncharacterized membrane protein
MVVFERSPWPTLTLVVSLEAIFLSCFVMIGQNRQAAFQQAKADHEFLEGEHELRLNTATRESELTLEVHGCVVESRRRNRNGLKTGRRLIRATQRPLSSQVEFRDQALAVLTALDLRARADEMPDK